MVQPLHLKAEPLTGCDAVYAPLTAEEFLGSVCLGFPTMPRFYLDILNGSAVLEDPDGQAFADVHAAMLEAAATARDLVAHGLLRNQDLSDRCVLIRDDAGETVARVPVRSALPGALSASP